MLESAFVQKDVQSITINMHVLYRTFSQTNDHSYCYSNNPTAFNFFKPKNPHGKRNVMMQILFSPPSLIERLTDQMNDFLQLG